MEQYDWRVSQTRERGVHGDSMSFVVGDIVDVIQRQWSGINREGGAARVTKVNVDQVTGAPASLFVAYIVGAESELYLPVRWVKFTQLAARGGSGCF